jgi:DNA-binding IscR family transcriptional regulator
MVMDFKLTKFELQIISHIDDSPSIGELANRIGVTKGYTSRLVASLVKKGFVDISTNGVSKNVGLSNNPHAVKLKNILHKRSYMPLSEFLQGSSIQVMAVLSTGEADFARLLDESELSEATLRRIIKKFKSYAVLVCRNKKYEIPQDLIDIKDFMKDYCSYIGVLKLRDISLQGRFIIPHGFEFLFTSDNKIMCEKVRSTGLSAMSDTIPLMLAENQYFYSSRTLSNEEFAVHAIVADPYSKRNLTYVILYILKVKNDKNRFVTISDQYGITDISRSILNMLDTGKQSEEIFMPSPSYIKQKAAEYNIIWQE